jgi:uncharacterized membrane protein YkvA (DUF1232 family)
LLKKAERGIIIYAGRKLAIMSEKKRLRDPGETAGLLSDILKQGRLILRLLGDGRVPIWPKLIIPGTVAYILSPIDFLADPILGLGQLDDIAVFLIGMKLFVELCPTEIVREHLDNLSSVVSGSYRVVVEEDEEQEEASQGRMIEGQEPTLQASEQRTELPSGSPEDETTG